MNVAVVCNNCNTSFTDHFGMIHEGYWPGAPLEEHPYLIKMSLDFSLC